MKRVAAIAVVGLLCLLEACGGGSNNTTPTTGGPLKIVFAAASPDSGGSPLRATLTANISGGTAPYYYAWDYSSDGSFDDYFNNIFLKTLSVQHDYYLTSTDGSNSVYHALLRVTDSTGASVTSDPVTVTVTPASNLAIDDVTVFSGTQGPTGSYILKSGDPVFFQPQISGGTAPYTYQWDFDSSGSVDSTLQNPQYTYTYTGEGAKTFVAHLRVVDALGNSAERDVLVVGVEGSGNSSGGGGGGGTGQPGFTIVLNSDPPADDQGNIILNWDASASQPDLPLEPHLQLSVVVDSSQGGQPPFEYYWDFENDGKFDSQAVSPTIPYYDSERKILVNPYLHQERTKVYTLRVFVIDRGGQLQEATRTVISNNVENSAGTLNVTDKYGIASSGSFKDNPPHAYSQVAGPLSETDVLFQVTATGGTKSYDWQMDIDGDGVADWPSLADDPSGFHALDASGAGSQLIQFGFHDDGQGNQVAEWPALGYYPVSATVRSLDTQGNPVQTFKVEMPVSLVRRDLVQPTAGTLLHRRGVVMDGRSAPAATDPTNGNYIPSRTVVISGGYTGTTALSNTQAVTQTYSAPTAPNTLEGSAGVMVADRQPMGSARAEAVGCTDGTNFFAIGGENNDSGILGLCEYQQLATDSSWTGCGYLNAPDFYPLTRAGGAYLPVAVGGTGPGFAFAGGLHPPGGSDVDNVSGRLIFTNLQDSDGNAANGIQLAFNTLPGSMVTERYDTCVAFANKRLYVIGGRVASGRSVSTVEAYNLQSGQWENVPAMQDFRSGASCQVIKDSHGDDIIYVLGGANYPANGGNRAMVGTAEALNTHNGVWSYTVGLPDGSSTESAAACALAGPGSAATLPAVTNQIWYFGGADANDADSNSLYEYTYFYTISPTP